MTIKPPRLLSPDFPALAGLGVDFLLDLTAQLLNGQPLPVQRGERQPVKSTAHSQTHSSNEYVTQHTLIAAMSMLHSTLSQQQ